MDKTYPPYKERLRILLILFYFSEPYNSPEDTRHVKVFESEVKIQKIDFLIRYPSYLCYELLRLAQETSIDPSEIRGLIKQIFKDKEPVLRTDEMKRFFFGAYEELDDVIGFLKSVGLIDFKSEKSISQKDIRKKYFITEFGNEKIENGLKQVESAKWYLERCQLIKQFFGDLSGNDLKKRQYEIETYRDTPLGTYIEDIESKVVQWFQESYQEAL